MAEWSKYPGASGNATARVSLGIGRWLEAFVERQRADGHLDWVATVDMFDGRDYRRVEYSAHGSKAAAVQAAEVCMATIKDQHQDGYRD